MARFDKKKLESSTARSPFWAGLCQAWPVPGTAQKAGTSSNNQTVGRSVTVPKKASVGKRGRRGIGRRGREGCRDRRWGRSLFGTRRDGDAGSIRHIPVTASAPPAFGTGSCSFARTALTCAPAGVSHSHHRPHRWRLRSPPFPSSITQDPLAAASRCGHGMGCEPYRERARIPSVEIPGFHLLHSRSIAAGSGEPSESARPLDHGARGWEVFWPFLRREDGEEEVVRRTPMVKLSRSRSLTRISTAVVAEGGERGKGWDVGHAVSA